MKGRKRKTAGGYIRETFTFNGKRYFVYGHTKEELTRKVLEKRNELEQAAAERKNPCLNDYYEYFTEIRRNEKKGATLRAQQSQYKLIAGTEITKGVTFGSLHIKDISRKDIETVRMILLKSGKSAENLNICFSHLNHVFNEAVNDDTIIKNPCKALKKLNRTSQTINDTKHRALTIEETIKFFTAAKERNSYYLPAFEMMINSGIRVGELGALSIKDIDSQNGFIHINKSITRDEIGAYYIGDTTKTKSGKRDIPINDELKRIIKEQENINNMFFGLSFINTPLFKSSEGGLLREYTINREIKRICKAAGINEFTCHCFRNTYATRFIEERPQDYKILSELLGHKNTKITLDLYVHAMTENKVAAMKDFKIKIS